MKTMKMFFLAIAFIVFACAPMGEEITLPSTSFSSATSIDPTTLNGTSQTFETVIVTLSQQSGNGSVQVSNYSVSSVVSWYGSTTTWTYTIVADADAKNISHLNFFGFDNCFWDNISVTEGLSLETEPSSTNCFAEDTQVIKYTPVNEAEQRSITFTWTFNNALKVNPSAGFAFVKAGTDCQSIAIPGPSCDKLTLTGVANQLVCDGTTSNQIALPNATVTATQGTQTLTATTDEVGGFTFPNIGGEWAVSLSPADDQLATLGGDDASVSFLLDNRPNGSCAQIVGYAEVIACVNQSPVATPFVNAVASCGHSSSTCGVDGRFVINNVPFGAHNVKIGSVVRTIEVTDHTQYDAGTFTIDLTGPICGGDEVSNCSLSQGYWFAKPNAVWPNGTVTIGGKTYTHGEGKAIWNTSNSKGLLNAKAAFLQASAIKLSGASVSPTSTVWADVQIIENYLASIAKLTPTTIPSDSRTGANAAAGAAAGRIGQWIQNNHCTEQ